MEGRGREGGTGHWSRDNGGEEVSAGVQHEDGASEADACGALAVEQPVAQLIESSGLLFVSAMQRGQSAESEAEGALSCATSLAAASRSASEKRAEGGGVTRLRIAQASRWRGVKQQQSVQHWWAVAQPQEWDWQGKGSEMAWPSQRERRSGEGRMPSEAER
jgi:hypothetical protein